jgi:hypothetical protein
VGAELDERAASTASAVEYADIVSSLYEVGCHRRAHAPESDKSNFHTIISV